MKETAPPYQSVSTIVDNGHNSEDGDGKAALKIPLTLFPRGAYNELLVLLKPEVWESDAP